MDRLSNSVGKDLVRDLSNRSLAERCRQPIATPPEPSWEGATLVVSRRAPDTRASAHAPGRVTRLARPGMVESLSAPGFNPNCRTVV